MITQLELNHIDENQVLNLAQQLAPLVQNGARIYLHGDLGAGKTTFVRALLRASGVSGRIKSPTFTLVEVYNVSRLQCYHFDFYRFNDPREWLDAGFGDIMNDDHLILIEWPEKAANTLPKPDLEIYITHQDDTRDYLLKSQSPRAQPWLNTLAKIF